MYSNHSTTINQNSPFLFGAKISASKDILPFHYIYISQQVSPIYHRGEDFNLNPRVSGTIAHKV